MDRDFLRIMCVVAFLAGAGITINGLWQFQQTGQPPGRLFDVGPFLLVLSTAGFIFPDRFDDRKFGWIVVIIAALVMLATEALLRSFSSN